LGAPPLGVVGWLTDSLRTITTDARALGVLTVLFVCVCG
jgi:hypothetical protein